VVAVNRRPGDTDEEVARVKKLALDAGAFGAEVNDGFANGGEGAAELAQAVADACEQPNTFGFSYEDDDSIEEKICKVAKKVYGAKDVIFYLDAQKKIKQFNEDGLDKLPICMAKTHLSFVFRPRPLERTGGLHPSGPRHPRVHRGRLAGAAVRRHPADARAGEGTGGAERGHRRGR
jgi:formyltetrahydrofolate synthetase